jgi:membrane-associated protein
MLSFLPHLGYIGITAVIFIESGIILGFFLPGDSLLFSAGLLASQHYISIIIAIPLFFLASVAGDNLGYFFGRSIGPALFTRDESFFFQRRNLMRAQKFFSDNGAKTIIIARFIPVVRTFVPVLAGVGTMTYKKYFLFDLIGGLAWTASIPLLGYYFGSRIPNVDAYILPLVILITVASFVPVAIQYFKTKRS